MKTFNIFIGIVLFIIAIGALYFFKIKGNLPEEHHIKNETISLPIPHTKKTMTLSEAISKRRSWRNYKNEPVSLEDLSHLLWTAQGITDQENKFRAAPSAGALYPLELYVVVGNITNLVPGIYHYLPDSHSLIKISDGDKRSELFGAALSQEPVAQAPATIVFTADFNRTTKKYGQKGKQFVFVEVGHAAENICLSAIALNLASITIGSFDIYTVKEIVPMADDEFPLYLLPIGKPK